MESKGLGDSIEKFTKATGIKTVVDKVSEGLNIPCGCLLYTSPSPRDRTRSRMPSSA